MTVDWATLTTERELQTAVIEIAKLHGWRVYHQRPARTAEGWRTALEGHAGFPDLVLARGGYRGHPARLFFIELKSSRGKLSRDQESWLEVLAQMPHAEIRVYTPRDLFEGMVLEELT